MMIYYYLLIVDNELTSSGRFNNSSVIACNFIFNPIPVFRVLCPACCDK